MIVESGGSERVGVEALERMLKPHMGKPAWPGLDDPQVKARARRYAKKYGLWDELGKALDRPAELHVLKRSFYRTHRRSGESFAIGVRFRAENARLRTTALRLWLGHPAADLDDLQDQIWAHCDTWTWTQAPHERSINPVDMFVTWRGDAMADILVVLEDQLEQEVKDRLRETLMQRVLLAAADPMRPPLWQTEAGLGNLMCNGSLVVIALNLIDDPHRLAAYLHPLIVNMQYGMDGYTADGGCLEGASHWEEGFAECFLDAALCLHHRTGGKLNLVDDPKVQTICRAGPALHTHGPHPVMFRCAVDRWYDSKIPLKINHFLDQPQAYWLVETNADRTVKVSDWRGLALWRGQKALSGFDRTDYLLADLGQVTMRGAKGNVPTVVAAVAGHNDLPHNDNDIGSFMFVRNGRVYLTDPGVHWYTSKTWGPRRYEILYCRSLGHSVPRVNGREQAAGSQYAGTLSAEGLNSGGDRTAVIDMTRAYPDRTLTRLQRRLVLTPRGVLTLTDAYAFTRRPRALEEAFVTFEPVTVGGGGRSVRIGKGRASVGMRADDDTPGRFVVQPMRQYVKEDRWGRVLNRIVFRPRDLSRQMSMSFTIGD